MIAPDFPAAADIPWHVERNLAGKSSAGTINVVLLGPKLAKKRKPHTKRHYKESNKLDSEPSNLVNEENSAPVSRNCGNQGHHKHCSGELKHLLYSIHFGSLVYKSTCWINILLCELKTIESNVQKEPCASCS